MAPGTRVSCVRLSVRGHVGAAAGGRFDLPTTVGALRDSHRTAVIECDPGVLKLSAALATAHVFNFHSTVGTCVFRQPLPPFTFGPCHH